MVIRSKPIKKIEKPNNSKVKVEKEKKVEKKQPKKNSLLDLIEEEEFNFDE